MMMVKMINNSTAPKLSTWVGATRPAASYSYCNSSSLLGVRRVDQSPYTSYLSRRDLHLAPRTRALYGTATQERETCVAGIHDHAIATQWSTPFGQKGRRQLRR